MEKDGWMEGVPREEKMEGWVWKTGMQKDRWLYLLQRMEVAAVNTSSEEHEWRRVDYILSRRRHLRDIGHLKVSYSRQRRVMVCRMRFKYRKRR